MQWSRQISEPKRANRYFENKRVLRGSKTPVKYLLFFQESKATKKKTSWQSVSGLFKFLRANSIHRCFCIILFVYLYIFKARKVVQWHADRQVTKRTWVRSQVPHPFQYHFSNNACVYSQRQGVSYVHIIMPSTRHTAFNQGSGSRVHGRHESTIPHACPKVNQALQSWAQIAD